MGQNLSPAVMQQRVEPIDSLDDFPTPPWATRALCEHLERLGVGRLRSLTVREPACGRGYMARTLAERFGEVEASDLHPYGYGAVADFLDLARPLAVVDWTITNPPFRRAEAFALRALRTSREGVALFVRSAFTEGAGRYQALFRAFPPSHVVQFTERVVLMKGRLPDPDVPEPRLDKRRGVFVMRKPTSATAYSWVIWDSQRRSPDAQTRFDWIIPCRRRLTRDGDYL